MADPQDGPDNGAGAVPPAPARKAAAKKAPAKAVTKAVTKAVAKPAKKAPAKKAGAKKAPATKSPARKTPARAAEKTPTPPPPQLALQPGHEAPALEAAPPHAALTAGRGPGTPPVLPAAPDGGRARLPLSIGLAIVGLAAVVLSRLRRG